MEHRMHLDNRPFRAFRSGTKTIEMRLWDEKRRVIRTGDTILFENRETGEKMRVTVTGTTVFESFSELYSRFDKASLGYEAGETADPADMEAYYPPEEEKRCGACAIRVCPGTFALLKRHSLMPAEERKLMDLYREGNADNAAWFYQNKPDPEQALRRAEADFLAFLRDSFFPEQENTYYILTSSDGTWVSALRLDRSGWIEALETHPKHRRKGLASLLLRLVIEDRRRQGPVILRDKISKSNTASLRTHLSCGFAVEYEKSAGAGGDDADPGYYGMRYEE